MRTVELVIDMGSKNTAVFKRGDGIVFYEPTAILVHVDKKLKPIAIGSEAVSYASDESNKLFFPVRRGAVEMEKPAALFLQQLIRRFVNEGVFFRPRVRVIAIIPCGLTTIEKRTVEKCYTAAGVSDTVLLENPLALLAYSKKSASLVMDIGAEITNAAIATLNGIKAGCTVDIGSETFTDAIENHMHDKHRMHLSRDTLEEVKYKIASLLDGDNCRVTVTGSNVMRDVTKSADVSSVELKGALKSAADKLAAVMRSVGSFTPRDICNTVYENKVLLAGGGAKLTGLDCYLSNQLEMPCYVVDSPETAACLGGGLLLSDRSKLSTMLSLKGV